MNNCASCGVLLAVNDNVEMKIHAVVDNPLKHSLGAGMKDVEWIPGTLRHRNCQFPQGDFEDVE